MCLADSVSMYIAFQRIGETDIFIERKIILDKWHDVW